MTQKTVYNTGYTRVPGTTARRYLAPTGEEISRREYIRRTEGITPEAKRAERISAGIKSHQGRYNALVRDYKKKNPGAKVRGPKAEEFKQIIKDLKSRDNSPHGKKAKALERLGRRGKDWEDYDVGESPE